MSRQMYHTLAMSLALSLLAAVPAAAQPAPAGNKPDVTLGSTPDTVIWGYISARVPPVLRVKPGTTVRIDTMSHQGLSIGVRLRRGNPESDDGEVMIERKCQPNPRSSRASSPTPRGNYSMQNNVLLPVEPVPAAPQSTP
jgi:hypothetical protein